MRNRSIWCAVFASAVFMGAAGESAEEHPTAVHQPGAAAHEASQAPPKTITNSIGMKFVLIPAGEFKMGSPDNQGGPQHGVRITRPFYLGMYEVTQSEYERVMGTNPSHFKPSGGRAPVEMVSWIDAHAFYRKLSEFPEERAAGRIYRLPTEAEWEYACRAGTTTKFSFGDDVERLGDYAWWSGNSGGTTHPVGQKKPNPWGLCDMHGNVAEWCQDWYDLYPHPPTVLFVRLSVDDPIGPDSGEAHVIRCDGNTFCAYRCASRVGGFPATRDCDIGFRLVLIIRRPAHP